jgi:Fe(3+) dicitrate transport protein
MVVSLSIGGRGLDPTELQFQHPSNGYDISADVLGYPESYYATPTGFRRKLFAVRLLAVWNSICIIW